MKEKLKQIAKLLYKKQKQIKKQSPEINIINFNRNKFGFPIELNQEKKQVKAPK